MAERFLYEIHPVRPFVSPDGKEIKKACSVQLTKDEVKEFMKKASLYRKFSGSNTKMERVTLSNLDELHVKDKGIVPVVSDTTVVEDTINESKDEVNIPDTVSEESIEEAPTEVDQESVVEETTEVSHEATTDETPVESTVEAETVEESSEEVNDIAEAEESTEDTVVEESVDDILKEGTVQSSNNYHHKNKKKHH